MKLQTLIDQYRAHQKSLGASTPPTGGYLGAFARFMGARTKVTDVQTEDVEAFLKGTGPRITQAWHTKHSILRGFYRYAISRGHVAVAPLPLAIPRKPPAFIPYIYSHDELSRLLRAAESHPNPQTSIDPVTMRTMLLLLYGAGLRVSEAIQLDRRDVNLKESLLTVRQTKFGKTRLVPFGSDLGRALTEYARRTSTAAGPFFTTRKGTQVKHDTFRHNFRLLCDRAAIRRDDGGRFQPRLHDLRHTFAVHRMTSWYRQGADVQKLLPQLSTYLGHVRLKDTQVYLKMTPELLQAASQRFERYAGKEERHD